MNRLPDLPLVYIIGIRINRSNYGYDRFVSAALILQLQYQQNTAAATTKQTGPRNSLCKTDRNVILSQSLHDATAATTSLLS